MISERQGFASSREVARFFIYKKREELFFFKKKEVEKA